MHEIKSSMKYSLVNYLSHKKKITKMDPVVHGISSNSLKGPQAFTLRNHEKPAVLIMLYQYCIYIFI